MSTCERAGCGGTYRPDGSCSDCGYKARAVPAARAAPASMPGFGHRRLSYGVLGAGLVDIAPVPAIDPASMVLPDPRVPPDRQRCRECQEPVGQARGGAPSFAVGYCPRDGTPFSFEPRLKPGDLVEARYHVLGCLAYGGMGWIYLARDVRLGDTEAERWVVLKGLIDAGEPDAVEAALYERRYLVQLNHPNIVKIYDFATHPDPLTGTNLGFLVMEYLGGQSLQARYLNHRDGSGSRAPLPLTDVLAYGVDVLQALGYVHDEGLVFCDLKPDNIMHVGRQIKLIDVGAMQRIGSPRPTLYGTKGYTAPEVERADDPAPPSVASDIYSVGRTLAVLSLPFAGFTTEYRYLLPEPRDMPLLAREESFHRLLRRATHPDPRHRFASAAAMREQLIGVLAEVLSNADGQPRPVASAKFTQERGPFGADAPPVVDWTAAPSALPTPLPDLADPHAGLLATLHPPDPAALVRALQSFAEPSPDVLLRLVDAHLGAGDLAGAHIHLALFIGTGAPDWRADWYRGVLALAERKPEDAFRAFDLVRDELPGELAPQLAMAFAAERTGDNAAAEELYRRIWHIDTGYVSAAFGLARMLRLRGDTAKAIEALDRMPHTSSQHLNAQVATIHMRLDSAHAVLPDLLDAAARLRRLELSAERHKRLTVDVLSIALRWVRLHPRSGGAHHVLGAELTERGLRLGLESAYRALAKLTDDNDARSRFVDHANRIRPRTLV